MKRNIVLFSTLLLVQSLIAQNIVATFEPLKDNELLAYGEYEGNSAGIYWQDIEDPYKFYYILSFRHNFTPQNIQIAEDRKYAITGGKKTAFFIDGKKGIVTKLENHDWQIKEWILSSDGAYILYRQNASDDEKESKFVLYDIKNQQAIKEFEWLPIDANYSIEKPIYKSGKFVIFISTNDGEVKAAAEIDPAEAELVVLFNTVDTATDGTYHGNIDDATWQSDTKATHTAAKVPDLVPLYNNQTWVDIHTVKGALAIGMLKDELVEKMGTPDSITVYPFENTSKPEWDTIEYIYDDGIVVQFFRGNEKVAVVSLETPSSYITIEESNIYPKRTTKKEIENLLGHGYFIMQNENNETYYKYYFSKKPEQLPAQDVVQFLYDKTERLKSIIIYEVL